MTRRRETEGGRFGDFFPSAAAGAGGFGFPSAAEPLQQREVECGASLCAGEPREVGRRVPASASDARGAEGNPRAEPGRRQGLQELP
jgi:hypothetical protein